MTVGENGIITKAQNAKIATEDAEWLENAQAILVQAYADEENIMALTDEVFETVDGAEEAILELKKEKMVSFLRNRFKEQSKTGEVYINIRDDGYFIIDGERYAIIDKNYNIQLISEGYYIATNEEWVFQKTTQGKCTLTAYIGEELSGIISIPSILIDKETGESYSVTALGNDLFSSTYIAGIDFSAVKDSLTSIGARTFMKCTNLSIQMPRRFTKYNNINWG